PARVPVELEPQGVLQLGHADPTRETRRLVDAAGVGGDAVDVGSGESGVREGREDGVDSEVEGIAHQPATDGRLAGAADDRVEVHDVAAVKSGSQTPACSWNSTRTRAPIGSAGTSPTRFVVRRRPGCSSSSTMATT